MRVLTIRRPDDFHVHLRQGASCDDYARDAWHAGFGRVLVMPNTVPPMSTGPDLRRYRDQIAKAAPGLQTVMTFKIRPGLSSDDLDELVSAGATAGKLYPEGVTTNSEDGVRRLEDVYSVFEAMEARDLVLCVHGEDPQAFSLDREAVFVRQLDDLRRRFPRLRIVLEHVSTADGIAAVRANGPLTAGTLTAHHLLLTLDDMVGGKLAPHLFCKPLLKRPEDRQLLVEAAVSGSPQFFFGSDSAPHAREAKEAALCSAGCYTMPVSLSVLAGLFEREGALERLEAFVSLTGAAFYRLPENPGVLTLRRSPWTVPAEYHGVVPLFAGQTLEWSVENPPQE